MGKPSFGHERTPTGGRSTNSYHVAVVIIGRDTELGVLRSLVDALRRGVSSSTLLWGEAGVGKTALLDGAHPTTNMAQQHGGGDLTVLRCAGAATESSVAYAGLTDLLRDHRSTIDALPSVQCSALRAALRLGPANGSDRLTVMEGVRSVVTTLAAEHPVLLIADDVHALDAPTSDVIAYLARRLGHAPIALLVAAREPMWIGAVDWDHVIEVSPLSQADSRLLVGTAWPMLGPRVVRAVVAASHGNPLAALEMPRTLTDAQRSGAVSLHPGDLDPGMRIRRSVRARLDALPAAVSATMLQLALSEAGVEATLAALPADIADEHLQLLLDARLLQTNAHGIDITHPLVRLATSQEASPSELRAAHRRLAEVLPEQAAVWHRAAITIGVDDAVAADLERTADDLMARGGPAAASAAYERAAQLSSAPEGRSARLFSAGRAALAAGHADHAVDLLDRARVDSEDPRAAARAHLLAGFATMWHIDARRGHQRLVAASDTSHLPLASRATLRAVGALAATAFDCRQALQLAIEAQALAAQAAAGDEGVTDPGAARAMAVAGTAAVWCLTLRGHAHEAASTFAQVAPMLRSVAPDSTEASALLFALNWRVESEDYDGALGFASAMAASAAERGDQAGRAGGLLVAGDAARRLGRWPDATATLTEALDLADASQQHGAVALASALLARLAAGRGRLHECREAIARLTRASAKVGMDSAVVFAGAAEGLLALGDDRANDAVEALEAVHAAADRLGLADPLFVPYLPDLIEAHSRLGHQHRAVELLELLAHRTMQTDSAGAHAALARCRGIVDRDDTQFATAAELHLRSGMPFEQGRTALAAGELLRRQRRPTRAAVELALALSIFESLEAAPWAARAARELAVAQRRSNGAALTAQQWQIASAAATGERNREIATRLFISQKTVERHLTTIYRIAGIRSRSQLAMWLANQPTASPAS